MRHLASVRVRCVSAVVLAGLFAVSCRTADADILVTWGNVGSDLVASFSGSIDTTGLAPVSGVSVGPQSIAAADPSSLIISFGFTAANGDTSADEYQISAAQVPPFAQLTTISTNIASTGDYFSAGAFPGLSDTLVVPLGYSSGDPLSGTITFAGESIASVFGTNLSTTPTVMFTLGNNDVSYALVPEPGSLAVLGLAGLGVGLAAWRRRKKGKSPEAGIRSPVAPLEERKPSIWRVDGFLHFAF